MDESFTKKEIGIDPKVHGYRILIKAVTFPELTKNGLVLPEIMRKRDSRAHNIGLILKMGPQALQPLERYIADYKVGDWVYYSSYEREQFDVGDHMCFWINDERIYCTLTEEEVKVLIPELKRYE